MLGSSMLGSHVGSMREKRCRAAASSALGFEEVAMDSITSDGSGEKAAIALMIAKAQFAPSPCASPAKRDASPGKAMEVAVLFPIPCLGFTVGFHVGFYVGSMSGCLDVLGYMAEFMLGYMSGSLLAPC